MRIGVEGAGRLGWDRVWPNVENEGSESKSESLTVTWSRWTRPVRSARSPRACPRASRPFPFFFVVGVVWLTRRSFFSALAFGILLSFVRATSFARATLARALSTATTPALPLAKVTPTPQPPPRRAARPPKRTPPPPPRTSHSRRSPTPEAPQARVAGKDAHPLDRLKRRTHPSAPFRDHQAMAIPLQAQAPQNRDPDLTDADPAVDLYPLHSSAPLLPRPSSSYSAHDDPHSQS